jgi:hypothetical protein
MRYPSSQLSQSQPKLSFPTTNPFLIGGLEGLEVHDEERQDNEEYEEESDETGQSR